MAGAWIRRMADLLKRLGQDLSSTGWMLEHDMSETTSSRLLTLLSLLQGRRDWPGSELADRLGVSPRTVRRDVERLRTLGYPVESMTGPAGGYQLRAGTAMPPLLLDDDEAIAIAVGLRTAAGGSVAGIEETAVRELVKLEQVLPSHLRRRVQALGQATQTLQVYGGPTVDPQCLTLLAAAVRDHERVRFAYTARDKADSRREVEPHALVNAGRRWYLVAWDRAREDWRTFRVDRIDAPASTGVRFTPRELPAKDAATFVEQSLRTFPSRYEARVTVYAPAAELEGRRWFGDVTPLGPTRCELRTSDDNLDWLAVRIAMLPADYVVHGPPELIERLREIGERIGGALQQER
jgi:predicted DNA-binding transcriptional regulator YafY